MKIDIGIGDNARREIADGLRVILADTYVLYLKTHGFHWNVVGGQFVQLHTFFEEEYRALWAVMDEIAERIRALGEPAPVSGAEMMKQATLAEASKIPPAAEMVKELLAGHEALIKVIRKVHPTAEGSGDEATVDLLNARLAAHEKSAWMLRSLAS